MTYPQISSSMNPTLILVTKLMLRDIKFIPVEQDCMFTHTHVHIQTYICRQQTHVLCTLGILLCMVKIDIDCIFLDLQFKLVTYCSWWVVTNWTDFIRVKETKIPVIHLAHATIAASI